MNLLVLRRKSQGACHSGMCLRFCESRLCTPAAEKGSKCVDGVVASTVRQR